MDDPGSQASPRVAERKRRAITILGVVMEIVGLIGLAFLVVTALTLPGRPISFSARLLDGWYFIAVGAAMSAGGFALVRPRWIGCLAPIVVAIVSVTASAGLLFLYATSGR